MIMDRERFNKIISFSEKEYEAYEKYLRENGGKPHKIVIGFGSGIGVSKSIVTEDDITDYDMW